MNNFYLTFLGLFISVNIICAQELDILTPKKMKKDLNELLDLLEAHPDPYDKISEADFNIIVDDISEKIETEMDIVDFYNQLSRITASIKDGHTSLYMPRKWLQSRRKEVGAFPLEVYLDNSDKLYVIKSDERESIPAGVRILSINDIPVLELIEQVDPFISYERKEFRNAVITRAFEMFLYKNFKTSNALNFKYVKLDTFETVVNNINYKSWKKNQKIDMEEREKQIAKGRPYGFEIISEGIGKINIYSFSTGDIDGYNLFLLETFKKIRKNEIHSLIIDVRGNYGGWPKIASELFHYIHNGHFKTMAKSSMKVSKAYRAAYLRRYPKIRDMTIMPQGRHFINLDAIINGEAGTFEDEEAFFNEAPINEKYEFSGDTYLLIDRRSFSASSSFAATFQCYSMGVVIGEKTGGTKIFRANATGKSLAKSSFYASVSTTKLHCACAIEELEPVTPNAEVASTFLHLVHGSDPQLDFALRLIKKVQKKKAASN